MNGYAEWDVRVTNLGPCDSSGFTVTDVVPSEYTDVQVTANSAQGWSNVSRNGNRVQVSHGPLEYKLGASDAENSATFRIRARATNTSVCVENTASTLGNESDPDSSNNETTDQRCSPSITKDVADDVPNNGQRGEITYRITVTNPVDGGNSTYDLTDSPLFSGLATITGTRVTADFDPTFRLVFDGFDPANPYVLATNRAIGPGDTHVYTVVVTYTVNGDPTTDPIAECELSWSSPGYGLFNTARLTDANGRVKDDDGCAPVVTADDIQLELLKTVTDGTTGPLPWAEFAIYDVAEGGAPGAKIKDLNELESERGWHHAVLEPGRQYYLVEEKAPNGYQLLAAPILFTVDWVNSPQGRVATVTIDNPADNLSASVRERDGQTESNVVIVQVADVTIGDLPLTGGRGITAWVLLASILLAAWGVGYAD